MMHRSLHGISRAIATLLLTAFVVGGLVAPSLHRALHSIEHTEITERTAQACDHSQHGAAFEVDRPAPLDEDCLLCVRQLVSVSGPALPLVGYHDSGEYGFEARPAPTQTSLSFSPIRGPPFGA